MIRRRGSRSCKRRSYERWGFRPQEPISRVQTIWHMPFHITPSNIGTSLPTALVFQGRRIRVLVRGLACILWRASRARFGRRCQCSTSSAVMDGFGFWFQGRFGKCEGGALKGCILGGRGSMPGVWRSARFGRHQATTRSCGSMRARLARGEGMDRPVLMGSGWEEQCENQEMYCKRN
jgi:hypothetical protein